MKRVAVVAGIVGLTLLWAPSAFAFDCSASLDSFNRPDSATLGPKWTQQEATIGIENFAATNPLATEGLATLTGAAATQACLDIHANGKVVQYAAIVLGYKDPKNNIFIKVQQSAASGMFDTAYFYYGNNGNNNTVWNGGTFSLTPFTQARIHAAIVGTEAVLEIDTNLDNVPDQTFRAPEVPIASLGSGIGVGSYGHALMSNFATAAGPAGPPVSGGGGTSGGGGATSGGGANPPAPTKATISRLAETNSTFAVGPTSTALTGQTAKAHKRGTIFSFALDQPATVTVEIQRKSQGRRLHHKCKPSSRSLLHQPACALYTSVTALTRVGHAATNKLPFTGRIGGAALKAGHYLAVFSAADAAGVSKPQSVAFTIAGH